ncbi:TerD family protein [Endozoicomonas sp. SM1973]|uniref:TerD family protein n=1 Tax=Spartinivicinus marinus TaxID=2994442 RepID=A0A853IDA6_9GAMM|nr:TerD family protein [Spartinivicinus marinus]MCX4029020.1 TerD family protein [Spartinivicinus marinus]NYZ65396.1 TerD family protein [Spartinivicinus marinus]
MAISLLKGGRVNLEKEAPGMTKMHVGLGWDVRATDGAAFDLDASLLMVNNEGKGIGEGGFVFYNSTKSACGSIQHMGDNLTGAGEGDDEVIKVTLPSIPAEVEKLVVVVTIHNAEERKQNFGLVENAFIRILNDDNQQEVVRYDLTEDYSTETSLIFGEIYKKDSEWRFVAKGDGFAGGLSAFLQTYGLA